METPDVGKTTKSSTARRVGQVLEGAARCQSRRHRRHGPRREGRQLPPRQGRADRRRVSIQNARDKAGLTKRLRRSTSELNGSLVNLRAFSAWLVARCLADPAARHDVREIIYSPEGKTVQRYSGIDNKIHTGPGNGDLTHRTHTHISFFRDSEQRDKVFLFQPFFQVGWGPDVSPADPRRRPNGVQGRGGHPGDRPRLRFADRHGRPQGGDEQGRS